jgi:hypothetical protein
LEPELENTTMGDSDSSAPTARADKASKAEAVAQAIAVPSATTATAPVKKTIEQWGEAKGLLPQVLPPANPNRKAAATLTVGPAAVMGLPQRHNPEYWKFAAAKAGNAWPDGFEITEVDFDAQIDAHTNLSHG